MFERSEEAQFKSIHGKEGGHYNVFAFQQGREMEVLRQWFPDGKANDLNQVLFSTSGVHGSYTTIEEIERGLRKYGENAEFEDDWPDDYAGSILTIMILQPRLCTIRYGNVNVTLADIEFLKDLRASSHAELAKIGMPS